MPKNINICGTSVWEVSKNTDIAGYWRQGKDEEPVLHLLHGNGFSSGSLMAMADAMPVGWTLMASDLPGHGLTTVSEMVWPDWNVMADRLAQNVLSRGVKPVVGVGHSMGGVITLLMAAKYPELFSQIILLDPVLFPTHMLLGQRIVKLSGLMGRMPLVKRARSRQQHWPDLESMEANLSRKSLYREWHPTAFKNFCITGSRVTNTGVELACSPDWEAKIFSSVPRGLWSSIRHLSVPAHILMAGHGFDFIPSGVHRAERLNPYISSQVLGGSHCFPMERPLETAAHIRALLETV